MPPRHAYWTILIDNQPTAFRAHDPDELLPTLNRLREKNDSAVMKWFERGQLFDSRDAARDAGLGRGERRWEGPRPERDEGERGRPSGAEFRSGDRERRPRPESDRRDRPRDKTWRPGGEHRDPRQKYKDAKKAKWNRFKDKIRARHEDRSPTDPETFTPPHGDKLRPREARDDRPRSRETRWDNQGSERERPREKPRQKPWDSRGGDRDRPRETRSDDRDRPREKPRDDRERPREKPWNDRERPRERPWNDRDRPREKRWDDRERPRDRGGDRNREGWSQNRESGPARPHGDPLRERREWKPKPPGGFRKKPFGAKPSGQKPFGRKPFGKKPSFGKKPYSARGDAPPRSGGGFRPRDTNRPPRRRRDDDE